MPKVGNKHNLTFAGFMLIILDLRFLSSKVFIQNILSWIQYYHIYVIQNNNNHIQMCRIHNVLSVAQSINRQIIQSKFSPT